MHSAMASASGAGRQQHHKLVAAQPGHHIRGGDAAPEPAGNLHQHVVPGLVAEDVVDLLEVVQVQQEDVHGLEPRSPCSARTSSALNTALLARPVSGSLKAMARSCSACAAKFGQGLLGLLLGLPARGDIAETPDPAHDPVAHLLRARVPLERPAVKEIDGVVAFRAGSPWSAPGRGPGKHSGSFTWPRITLHGGFV